MKESVGELNITLVVISAIGVLSIFFYTSVWPILRDNMDSKTKCTKAICENVLAGDNHKNQVKCKYNNNDIYCPYSG